MNENYAQATLPESARDGVIKGAYRFGSHGAGEPQVTLMGSGAILTEVIKAAQALAADGVPCEVISVTSWSELARQGAGPEEPWITELLSRSSAPVVAATDYVRAVPEAVRQLVPAGRAYTTLGTDGFGRSDTRAALRDFFGVDAAHIVQVARQALKQS
jgi:pyruvate dehydrogenase E1 component